jgi:lysophospholipase L1-like esterase
MITIPAVPRKLPLSRKALYSAIVVLVVFGLPELVLRLFVGPPAETPVVGQRQFVRWLSNLSVDPRSSQPLYETDRDRLWRLVPGLQIESFNPHYDPRHGERQAIHININTAGYRGPLAAPRKRPGTLRVLCMGDSNIFGYPLDDADALPSALARALGQVRDPATVEVINGGTPGYTVLQGGRWYQQQFEDHDCDWLVLSYLNNDAWLQPQSDATLMGRQQHLPGWLVSLADNVQLLRWGQACKDRLAARGPLVPRVAMQEYLAGYHAFVDAAQRKGARVMILDFRGYTDYEPYSQALERLAQETGSNYFLVMAACGKAIEDFDQFQKYGDRLARVQRRWGSTLDAHNYLWLYSEAVSPEHLNELGTAWLADQLCPTLTAPSTER